MENETEMNGFITNLTLNSYITHFTRLDLRVVWGEPNEKEKMKDVWYIGDNMKLVVNYHKNDGKAVDCCIMRTE